MLERCSIAALALALAATAVACEVEDDAAVDPRSEAGNGWQINGWQINGTALSNVQLSGSLLTANQTINGTVVVRSGLDLIGARFLLTSGQTTYTLRIDDIFKNPADPAGDVYFYRVSVHDVSTDTWSSLCYDANGSPTEAIPLAGRWDATGARVDDASAITLACRGYVLAKCVEWGYRPWASAKVCSQGQCPIVSLRDHHQACTRMARADYCGDGRPHTIEGTPIDIYDRLAIPIQTEGTQSLVNWQVEAEWGPEGARCVGDALRLHLLDELDIPYEYPTCLDTLAATNCGSFAANRAALLADKYCEPWVTGIAQCGGVYEGREAQAKLMK
jgi:hypothetical protein